MPIRFAAFALLCLGWTSVHAARPTHRPAQLPAQLPIQLPQYAPVKERICTDCPMPKPGVELPRHGVVLGSWGFFSYGSHYHVVDLDRGMLVNTFVPSPGVPGAPRPKRGVPKARQAVALPKSELPQLVELANRIWAKPHAIRTRDATDVSWDMWLIDGQQIRHESGAGLPDGLAAEWLRRINKLSGVQDASPGEIGRDK
jgi:hypothetical protein